MLKEIAMIDCVELAQKLIQCPSITPNDAGCLDIIEKHLGNMGFTCWRLPYGEVDNLYARLGKAQPNFCFAGHTDVVPIIDPSAWSHAPFGGVIENETLFGRGAVDMKGAIAAYITALSHFTPEFSQNSGSLSLILTSDEEGPGINGTKKVIEWLQKRGEVIDACLVGEPTNPTKIGEMVKIGRRGSLNGKVIATGLAGHVAYPENAINPIPILLNYLKTLHSSNFDIGNENFDPTHLEITSVDVGNGAKNVIPAKASAHFNIRFNDEQTGSELSKWLTQKAETTSDRLNVRIDISGEAFYCPDERLKSILSEIIEERIGQKPIFSTSGGTSDARFLKDICPVIEFGLVNKTAHHINEHVHMDEIRLLCDIYYKMLEKYFVSAHSMNSLNKN